QESIVFTCSYEPISVDWCALPETKSKIDSYLKSCTDGVPQGSSIKTNKVDCDSSTQTLNPVCIYQDSTNPNPDPDTPNYSDVISHMNLINREIKTLFDEA
ncbi:hypothetical protein, partial [Photobacterium damselae]|uniref:hypothetical protein n=1 Tax=Photobacterium damselae TaxID=38293 RepID=UPI0014856004